MLYTEYDRPPNECVLNCPWPTALRKVVGGQNEVTLIAIWNCLKNLNRADALNGDRYKLSGLKKQSKEPRGIVN